MKVKKDTGGFVTNEDVKTNELITFLNEGEEIEKEFEGKKKVQLVIGVKLPDGTEKLMSLNSTSRNNMIDTYGGDTKDWVNKEARVETVSQMIAGKMKKVVYLTAPNTDMEGNVIVK